jgi:mono/diheme cytochrome c family protein
MRPIPLLPAVLLALLATTGAGVSTRTVQAAADERPAVAGASDAFLILNRVGRAIFRFDTFGDEQLWTGVLRMHEPIATLSPEQALGVGLKVDAEALPPAVVALLKAGDVDLTDPAVTLTLLKANAVVGVRGTVTPAGALTSVGITCALCHSTVDDSLAPGIGRRLDGWANTSLDVGAILGLSPALDAATKAEFATWGPGKYDPRHHYFDGTRIVPLNSPTIPVVIPPIYGLRHVGFETVSGDGPISYWNSYVGVGQMGGQGSFHDPRIGVRIVQRPDLVTPKLFPLLVYQLGLDAPRPPADTVDLTAAARGRLVFAGAAGCARCHRGPALTDVLSGPPRSWPVLHDPAEVGTDPAYAARTATKRYRTTPLRALFQHAPYFHDGSAADLAAVVEHYDAHFGLNLSASQKADLIAYLKSL